MKKILTFGTFDLFHPGHISYLNQAKKLGGKLCVCVARDVNVEKHKGHKPRWNEEKRKNEVQKCFDDAEVSLGYEKDVYRCLSDIKPDIIALGYDQNIFVNNLESELIKRDLSETKIVRLKSFKPKKYKSSLVKDSNI